MKAQILNNFDWYLTHTTLISDVGTMVERKLP